MQFYCFTGPKGEKTSISKIAMGCYGMGDEKSPELSFSLLDYYLSQGGSCIDTARRYGFGISEQTIGRWMRERQNRNRIFLCTKGGHPPKEDIHISRLSREEIDSDLEQSLRDLDTDHVDLYFLHRDDEKRLVSDIMEILDRHVRSGKVLALGASNWSTRRIEEANRFALENGLTPFSASQIQWSLASATPEMLRDDTLQTMNPTAYGWYLKEQMPVFSFSSQAGGFFQRFIAHGDAPVDRKIHKWAKYLTEGNRLRAQRLELLHRETGYSVSGLALAYLTSNPVPTLPIIGCGRMETLRDSLAETDILLSPEQIAFLEGSSDMG